MEEDNAGYLVGNNINNYDSIPVCMSEYYLKNFIRGFFDRYGVIDKKTLLNTSLNCCIIAYTKKNIVKKIKEYCNNIKSSMYNEHNGELCYSDKNALDFLHYIYYNSDARYRLENNYKIYLEWIAEGKNLPICKFEINNLNAVKPIKNNICNFSYDLTIIKKIKDNGLISLYDTGIIIKPDFGYNIKLIPHNNLIEKGFLIYKYMYKNDNKSIKIYMAKINNIVPDITIPCVVCSIVLEKNIYFEIE